MITKDDIGKKVFLNKSYTIGLHPNCFLAPKNTVLVVKNVDDDRISCESVFGKLCLRQSEISKQKS